MRAEEVFGPADDVLTTGEITETSPLKPLKPIKPLTPAQSRTRADKLTKAQAKLSDTKAQAAIKINAAARKISDI